MLQQFIEEVDVEMGQLIAPVLGLGGSWIGMPTSFPSSSLPGELSNTASSSSPNIACSKEQDQFCSRVLGSGSPTLTTRVSSIVLPRQGAEPSLPIVVGDIRGGMMPALLLSYPMRYTKFFSVIHFIFKF